MAVHAAPPHSSRLNPPRWLVIFLILGLYLTLRGYHSRDNDQAYRLPLLLHRQDPALFADDPFVRAFDAFNPHRGYLALLDAASRPFGLSAGLFGLFALTFAATCHGLDRMARAAWPECGRGVGLVAIGLALTAKAGNVGTNHLFEALLLDRLAGFALGWLALAWVVEDAAGRGGRAAIAIGLAALIHPSVGLQLALLLGVAWIAWALRPGATGVAPRQAAFGLAALGLALVPMGILQMGQAGRLYQGLPAEEFRLLSVELQSPQHMLPHLWRLPQWLAFGCYPILALLALGKGGKTPWPRARTRLVVLLVVNLAALGLAWLGVEVFRSLGVTLFQPFRMATLFRGLALVAASGRIFVLWRDGRFVDRARAAMVAVGLAGDGMLVVATVVDVACVMLEVAGSRGLFRDRLGPRTRLVAFVAVTAMGLGYLWRHDTESGHVPLIATLTAVGVVPWAIRRRVPGWDRRRLAFALAGSWAVPALALLAANAGEPGVRWAAPLIERCRFAAVPTDDVERLALWCRKHTPADARFIGPPGPKTFRLWSLRSLAFNRAASPYHAEGLADWAARFRDHVGFEGSFAELVRAYHGDRHGLERRYQEMGDDELAALAVQQGARYVVAGPTATGSPPRGNGPLERLQVEGRYAVYRVRDPRAGTPGPAPISIPISIPHPSPVQARTTGTASAGTG